MRRLAVPVSDRIRPRAFGKRWLGSDVLNSLQPAVSVIVPTYNRANTVFNAIDSCLAASGLSVEVVVVDDGSSDATVAELSSRYGASGTRNLMGDNCVIWCVQPNSGACVARNRGLDMAIGQFVKFLDSDDWLNPGALEKEVCFARDTGADVIVTGWEELDNDDSGELRRTVHAAPRMDRGIDDMLLGRGPITTTGLYRRTAVRHLSWNPSCRKAQDWEWAWAVALSGARFRSLDISSFVYDRRGDNRIGTDPCALELAVKERQRILAMVELRLAELDQLTTERRHLLANYYYKDRLTLCRKDRRAWKRLWQHCRELGAPPPEPVTIIRILGYMIGRYSAVIIYDSLKRMLGR